MTSAKNVVPKHKTITNRDLLDALLHECSEDELSQNVTVHFEDEFYPVCGSFLELEVEMVGSTKTYLDLRTELLGATSCELEKDLVFRDFEDNSVVVTGLGVSVSGDAADGILDFGHIYLEAD